MQNPTLGFYSLRVKEVKKEKWNRATIRQVTARVDRTKRRSDPLFLSIISGV
jgi:hypothetical protein